jgi:hypothetical protein
MNAASLELPRLDWPQPGGLWSAWDIMHRINPGILLKINDLVREVGEAAAPHSAADMGDISAQFAEKTGDIISDLNLRVAIRVLEDVRGAKTGKDLREALSHFRRTMQAELETRAFFVLREDLYPYFGLKEPFGDEVTAKFPTTIDDIENAAKCIALELPTACVFHLMRAMEAAVGALCGKLSIPNTDRVWGMLLSDLHKEIEAMPKGKDRNAWSEAHTNLYHVKQAWRNDTMHPKQTYTTEQAQEVFEATKTFMRHLARLV